MFILRNLFQHKCRALQTEFYLKKNESSKCSIFFQLDEKSVGLILPSSEDHTTITTVENMLAYRDTVKSLRNLGVWPPK